MFFKKKSETTKLASRAGRKKNARMQLFSGPMCPYTASIRVQIYMKGLPVDVVGAPISSQSEDYRKYNPLGKIPVLDAGDGLYLPESLPILEYLEDIFEASPDLRPADPAQLAQVRVLMRMPELYFYPNALTLVHLLGVQDRDQNLVEEKLARLSRLMSNLDAFLSRWSGKHAIGDQFTLADCALTPGMFYVEFVMGLYQRDAFAKVPAVKRYWGRLKNVPEANRVIGEMDKAFRAELGLPAA